MRGACRLGGRVILLWSAGATTASAHEHDEILTRMLLPGLIAVGTALTFVAAMVWNLLRVPPRRRTRRLLRQRMRGKR